MKKIYTLLIAFILIQNISTAQTLWANSWGGSGFDISTAMEVNNQDEVIVAGIFNGLVDFDPGDGYVLIEGMNFSDIFIQNFDNQGNLNWVKVILSDFELSCNGIYIDQSSNIYVIGEFYETVDFDPGLGTHYETASGSTDAFVLKLDSEGEFQWVNIIQGDANEFAIDIQGDNNNNIFLSGFFNGTVDFDPGIEENFISAQGTGDAFIQKVSSSGELLWIKVISNASLVQVMKIGINNQNDVHIIGKINETTDFDPGLGEQNYTPVLNETSYLLSLSDQGEFNWYNISESSDQIVYTDLKFDIDDNLFLTGRYKGTCDFDPSSEIDSYTVGSYDVFISKYDDIGVYQWIKFIGGTGDAGIQAMELDSEHNISLIGSYFNPVDFDPGPDEVNLEESLNNLYILTLNQNGEFNSVLSIAASNLIYSGDLALSNIDEMYLLGYYTDSIDVDLSEQEEFIQSNGFTDLFLVKIGYTLGIEIDSKNIGLLIYPNPCSNYFSISTTNIIDYKVEIFDMNAKQVFQNNHLELNTRIDISSLTPGTYFIKFSSSNEVFVKKLVVR